MLALRHNLEQLEHERQIDLALTRAMYERSLSWRITRPLRSAEHWLCRTRG